MLKKITDSWEQNQLFSNTRDKKTEKLRGCALYLSPSSGGKKSKHFFKCSKKGFILINLILNDFVIKF